MDNKYEDELSFKELLDILFKRKKIIIYSVLIMIVLSISYSYFPIFDTKKNYEAVSSISIIYNYKTPKNPEEIGEGYVYYQDRLQNIMIPTIQSYARSLTIIRDVITELELKDNKGNYINSNKLSKKIKIENQTGSNSITITVKYNDEKLAADIANLIPKKLIETAKSNSELSDYQINIIDFAIASEIEETNEIIPIFFGAFIGFSLGIFLALLLNYLSTKIQTEFQLRTIGLNVDLVIKKPVQSNELKMILSIIALSNAERAVIGTNNDLSFSSLLETTKTNEFAKIEVIDYNSSDFLLKAKKYDLSVLIIEEKKSDIKKIRELARLIHRYNINNAVIYVEN